jgi:hypothetical protein
MNFGVFDCFSIEPQFNRITGAAFLAQSLPIRPSRRTFITPPSLPLLPSGDQSIGLSDYSTIRPYVLITPIRSSLVSRNEFPRQVLKYEETSRVIRSSLVPQERVPMTIKRKSYSHTVRCCFDVQRANVQRSTYSFNVQRRACAHYTTFENFQDFFQLVLKRVIYHLNYW